MPLCFLKKIKYMTFIDLENSKWPPKAKKMGAKLGNL